MTDVHWMDQKYADMLEGLEHYMTIEFMIGGYDYVRDDMWIGRS